MGENIILDNTLGFRTAEPVLQESPELENIRLRALLEVSRRINSISDPHRLMDLVTAAAAELTDAESAVILLLDKTTASLRIEATAGVNNAELKSIPVPLVRGVEGRTIINNQPQMVSTVHFSPCLFTGSDQQSHFNFQSILAVPVQVNDEVIGVIEVFNRCHHHDFTRQDLRTLETLAASAAVAIDNVRLHKELESQMQVLRETRTRLSQRENFAAVGEQVAGVAHELSNPLTLIIGLAELIKLKATDAESRHDLDTIVTQGQRVAGIARGLLNFTQPQQTVHNLLQINDLLKHTLADFSQEFRANNILIRTHFSSNLPLTVGEPRLLQQAFGHLVKNSCQAISNNQNQGTLTVVTQLGPSQFSGLSELNQANRVDTTPVIKITIHDDGPGIPPEHMSRIFSPFFTTKRPEEGIGLGLSVCNSIVSEHGGHLWTESTAGQGTTIFIELPIITANLPGRPNLLSQTHRHQINQQESGTTASGRVLVVGDDKRSLTTLNQTLQAAGFQVDTVTDGKVALLCLAEINYDLIVYDMGLSTLSGYDLYQWLQKRKLNLAQRIIFITDEGISLTTRHFLHKVNAPHQSKPIDAGQLINNARSMVGAA